LPRRGRRVHKFSWWSAARSGSVAATPIAKKRQPFDSAGKAQRRPNHSHRRPRAHWADRALARPKPGKSPPNSGAGRTCTKDVPVRASAGRPASRVLSALPATARPGQLYILGNNLAMVKEKRRFAKSPGSEPRNPTAARKTPFLFLLNMQNQMVAYCCHGVQCFKGSAGRCDQAGTARTVPLRAPGRTGKRLIQRAPARVLCHDSGRR